ncbi:alpha-hydroxy acid oxidase [Kytococcus sedentarius]|uniref:Alpha-hydroxyacid dehydrogenase, FMN-dependent L-lactate dehydrogenase n=1 Tax=Kytococcus sedentarius (strain ATCC 14392 / DSM 20547 / JCM 11482 / CCUG 33030 / NBRC 15357 / NCTC 11040 / CCM 314 / 541) TaxID=478801 RepID=C7NJZ2_KYTSD|nr:alpha-hydroxy acid oxidase [Kytococcus sedentarius]ACV05379.1 alpha-hydroxyacid dehydrogenase, FMN-dependent L-lactate dehydrogenase [Kytococcus sedentarius DSM 20547]
MRRQLPNPRELAPLMRFSKPTLNRTTARLAKAADIADVRRIARRVTPTGPFDYVDGAANSEESMRRNTEAYRNLELRPTVLRDVGEVDLSTEVFGQRSELPVGLAPTGFTRMMHAAGEPAVARAAQSAGVPYTLSTMGTTAIEDLAAQVPDARRWFQLYSWREDRDRARGLVERAQENGYDTLMVTVDTATGGLRYRDHRNGMTIPPQLTARTLVDASYRPRWWFDFLTTEPLRFATLSSSAGDSMDVIMKTFDPTLSWADIEWIREVWAGPLLVKGIQTPSDAQRALDAGCDGVYLSNHGGRQLDRAPVPLAELPGIREVLGPDVPIIVDSGITSGVDVLGALALGADFTMIGRAYLYGLMAGGQRGVERVLDILRAELQVGMQLLGVRSVDELGPQHVRLDHRAPRD